jgi:hypothetical protein
LFHPMLRLLTAVEGGPTDDEAAATSPDPPATDPGDFEPGERRPIEPRREVG